MRTFEVRKKRLVVLTRAPLRFLPRTRSLTGLIVCPAHHDGGSTLLIDALCANESATKKHNRHKKIDESLLCLLCFFMAVILASLLVCVASRCRRRPSRAKAAESLHLSYSSTVTRRAGSLHPSA